MRRGPELRMKRDGRTHLACPDEACARRKAACCLSGPNLLSIADGRGTSWRAQTGCRAESFVAAIHPSIGIARVGNSPDGCFYRPRGHRSAPAAARLLSRRERRAEAAGRALPHLRAQCRRRGRARADRRRMPRSRGPCTSRTRRRPGTSSSSRSTSPRRRRRRRRCCATSRSATAPSLMIDPGPRTHQRHERHGGPKHTFDSGQFMGTPVYLGELRTDEAGRLVVLGGRGKSASYDGKRADHLRQQRRLARRRLRRPGHRHGDARTAGRSPVDPAWVVVAPPNYAPDAEVGAHHVGPDARRGHSRPAG